jgi:hypothetical protein
MAREHADVVRYSCRDSGGRVSVGLFGYLELRSMVRSLLACVRPEAVRHPSKHLVANKVPCVSNSLDVHILTACALTLPAAVLMQGVLLVHETLCLRYLDTRIGSYWN